MEVQELIAKLRSFEPGKDVYLDNGLDIFGVKADDKGRPVLLTRDTQAYDRDL